MSTKTNTKQAPAQVEEPTAAKPLNRAALLATLKEQGYTGPTSFTATALRDVVAWFEVGAPKDADVPRGVLLAVHPNLRPAATAKAPRPTAFQRGFREAVAAVDGLGDDLQAIRRWVAANTAQEV